jgi:hypothetical protein
LSDRALQHHSMGTRRRPCFLLLERAKRQASAATLSPFIISDSRAGGCQHNSDSVVSVWTTRAARELGRQSESIEPKWLCTAQSHSLSFNFIN